MSIRLCLYVALLAGFVHTSVAQKIPYESDSAPQVRLSKHQLAALGAALRETRKSGRNVRGKQVSIIDRGKSFHISFYDDPVDARSLGDGNGVGWEVQKRDAKVVRELLFR